jgi:hypothetical protein
MVIYISQGISFLISSHSALLSYARLNELNLQSKDEKNEFTAHFISYDYVKFKVSQGFFFQKTAQPPKAPDSFEFVEIRRNREKERLKREREVKKRQRSP